MYYMSGFCHFGLMSSWVLWQSPDTTVMSCFHVSVRLRACSNALFRVGAWCSDTRHSCLKFRFPVRVRTLALRVLSHCLSVRSRVRSATCSSVHVCCVLCCTQFMFYRLRAFLLCLVLCGTQLVYFIGCVFSCCPVLCEHVAYEYSH